MNIKRTIEIIIRQAVLIFSRKKYDTFPVRKNSVLLIEFYNIHGETLPGFIKYLLDLGYNVDVFLQKPNGKDRNDLELFLCFKMNDNVRIKTISYFDFNLLLHSDAVAKYEHVFFNTLHDGVEYRHLFKIDLFKLKPVCVAHNPEINREYFRTDKIISLVKMDRINEKPPLVVNPHYFCEFKKREKSQKTVFVAFYSKIFYRRNIYLLFEACDALFTKGIRNFSVKIIGNKMEIPVKYRDNFIIFGFLDFQKMYEETIDSDFLLALIDQASVQYTNKASGTYQLSYGFLKPIVLHKKFSDVSGFNDKNSILYNDNHDLADAMEKCINMSCDDYSALVCELEISEKELYNMSLNNLKKALNSTLD
jgi:hypothetical protein